MIFSLDVLRARKGDCLLLHFGTKAKPRLVMIDGGPSGVYRPFLRPRLVKIRKARGLSNQDSLPVEALMVSHVDDDHIKGVLDLATELLDDQGAQAPYLVDVSDLWHNTFDDLLETKEDGLSNVAAGYGIAAVGGAIDVANDTEFDVAKVLAGIAQGRDLRIDAATLNWKINKKFGEKLIVATKQSKAVKLAGSVEMTVVGPLKPELDDLRKKHDKWLRDNADKIADSSAGVPASYTDSSVHNLSSLVFLAEANGKRMLLTGDARGDKILEGLQLVGLMAKGKSSTLHVDVLKVPHHGSSNNLVKSFFRRVTADHYVFSGNGEHGNPERETMEMLFSARPNAAFTIHLTYPIDDIDKEREKDWKKAQEQEKRRRSKSKTAAAKKKVKVRPNWSAAKNGLAAFFKANPLKNNQEIRIVDPASGHVIDLLDPIGDSWPSLSGPN